MKSDDIVPRKDTLHRAPEGHLADAPERRRRTGPLDGHPPSATEKIRSIAPPGMYSFIEDGINLDTNPVCES